MFKFDSTHGNFKGTIDIVDDSTLKINGKQIKILSKRYSYEKSYVITFKITSGKVLHGF